MFAGAAVCPHPPLLVPAAAAGAAAEADDLRTACIASVRRLAGLDADRLVVVGTATETGSWDGTAGGSLRRFGVQVEFGGHDLVLPLSLTLGAYLLDEVGWTGQREYVALAADTPPGAAAHAGVELVAGPACVALLVMGDGSAKRSETAPGYLDERAKPFDAAVVEALARPDPTGLLQLDPLVADELWVAGRPAWQLLAGAANTAYDQGATISASLRYDDAPYGVGYWVVDWQVTAAAPRDGG